MLASKSIRLCLAASLAAAMLIGTSGCKQLPGSPQAQGATIGGLGGAAAGAAIARNHVLGALIGGVLGAGGGYLIGANKDKITGHDTQAAQQAGHLAQTTPATPAQALAANTADLNHDGFVTMDEIVAMKEANLSDQQILQRLGATGAVFELTPAQQNYLREHGISSYVINQMPELNREVRNQLAGQTPAGVSSSVVGAPPQ